MRGVRGVMLCPQHCQGLMDTAQQSQNRAGMGAALAAASRTQLISVLPQALPPWQDRGVCPQSPPVPMDSEGAATAMNGRTTAGEGEKKAKLGCWALLAASPVQPAKSPLADENQIPVGR